MRKFLWLLPLLLLISCAKKPVGMAYPEWDVSTRDISVRNISLQPAAVMVEPVSREIISGEPEQAAEIQGEGMKADVEKAVKEFKMKPNRKPSVIKAETVPAGESIANAKTIKIVEEFRLLSSNPSESFFSWCINYYWVFLLAIVFVLMILLLVLFLATRN